MFKYCFKRIGMAIPVMWIAITLCFFMLRLAPGGPFDLERPLPPAVLKNLEAHYHLDKPLVAQYFHYLSGVVRGDLGPSFSSPDFSVSEQLANGIPFTFKLAGYALIFSLFGGVVCGIFGMYFRNQLPDYVLGGLLMLVLIIPSFVIAPILQLFFGLTLSWLPVGGWGDGSLKYMILPVMVMSSSHITRISRLLRGSMIEVMNSNFVRTARAKGVSDIHLILKHCLKPALTPILSYMGPAASYLLTGSLIIETIFSVPGVGRTFVTSALNRDYGMVLGTVIFYMFLILILNLIVDLLYAWLDPRVREK